MSYAGNATRKRKPIARDGSTPRTQPTALRAEPAVSHRAWRARPEWVEAVDWREVAVFTAGITAGLLAGVGATLLMAPRSGADTRRVLARGVRRAGTRTHDAWDDLRDELSCATRRSRRKLGKAVTRGRWALADRFTSATSDDD